MSQFPSLRLAAICLLALAACRPTIRSQVAMPDPSTVSMTPRDARSASAAPADGLPRRLSEPTTDELTTTVTAILGDLAVRADEASGGISVPVWDIDVHSYETNQRVAHYVGVFSRNGGKFFSAQLSQGTRYDAMIRAKLRAGGLPEDLSYLALIESGYDPHAYSSAAAVGMWQFMATTARAVGLRVDWWVDERRDPARATEGAMRFLTDLQRQFGSLYLAVAAYNGGPGRVSRGLTQFASALEDTEGEDRFFALAQQDYLRAETRNYVPKLIGAALVAKTPLQYGMFVDTLAPWSFDSVWAAPGTSLSAIATASGSSVEEMKDLNPSILRGVVPPDAAHWVHVPTGTARVADSTLHQMSSDTRIGFHLFNVAGTSTSLAALASRHGLHAGQLRWFNPELRTTSKGKVVSGQSVRIPTASVLAFARDVADPSVERYGGAGSASTRNSVRSASNTAGSSARSTTHVVKRGETLGGIAVRYRTTVARLRSLNSLKSTRVQAGQSLRITSVSNTLGNAANKATSKGPKKAVTKKSAKPTKTKTKKSAKK